ncbi:hypothetical protein QTN25_010623 [Entamoeba marina]
MTSRRAKGESILNYIELKFNPKNIVDEEVIDFLKYQPEPNKDFKEFKFLLYFERNNRNESYVDMNIEEIAGVTHDGKVREYRYDDVTGCYFNVMKTEEKLGYKILIYNKLENSFTIRDPEENELTFNRFTITDLNEDERIVKLLQV